MPCLPCMAAVAAAGPPGWALAAVAGGAIYAAHRMSNGTPDGTSVGATTSQIKMADATVHEVLGNVPASLRQIVLAIGLFETGYGLTGSWIMEDGTPSYNWGGLVGKGTAGSITHGDRDKDGNSYTTPFQAHKSMADGLRSFMRTFTSYNALGPAEQGNVRGTAEAMYGKPGRRYFTGIRGSDSDRIEAYANAIMSSATQIAKELGEPLAVSLKGHGSKTVPILLAGAATGAAFALGAPIVVLVGAPLAVYWLATR